MSSRERSAAAWPMWWVVAILLAALCGVLGGLVFVVHSIVTAIF